MKRYIVDLEMEHEKEEQKKIIERYKEFSVVYGFGILKQILKIRRVWTSLMLIQT